jgi:hypothetical protein
MIPQETSAYPVSKSNKKEKDLSNKMEANLKKAMLGNSKDNKTKKFNFQSINNEVNLNNNSIPNIQNYNITNKHGNSFINKVEGSNIQLNMNITTININGDKNKLLKPKERAERIDKDYNVILYIIKDY